MEWFTKAVTQHFLEKSLKNINKKDEKSEKMHVCCILVFCMFFAVMCVCVYCCCLCWPFVKVPLNMSTVFTTFVLWTSHYLIWQSLRHCFLYININYLDPKLHHMFTRPVFILGTCRFIYLYSYIKSNAWFYKCLISAHICWNHLFMWLGLSQTGSTLSIVYTRSDCRLTIYL